MKKACSVCLSNCLRQHGAQEENQDMAACLLCASRKLQENENRNLQKAQADRNPSFLKKMTKSNMSTLKLPLSFVRDQIHRLDGSVTLEGPSKGKWKVELQGSFQSFSLNFGHGWEKFVADHVLQIDDLLTFSLSAKSYFQVEVYDGGGCQKTSALDAEIPEPEVADVARSVAGVAKAARPTVEVVQAAKLVAKAARSVAEVAKATRPAADAVQAGGSVAEVAEVKGPPTEAVQATSVVEGAEAARPVAEVFQAVGSVAEIPEVAEAAIPEGLDDLEVFQAVGSVAEIPEVSEAAKSEGLDDPDSGDGLIKLAKSDPLGLLPDHQIIRGNVFSTRRSVTELEKERALQAAEALELANPNIILVMSKQNVYKGFWLGISKQFAKEWMPSENKEVTIVNKGGHSWPAKWIASRGGLSAGWRRFSLDHHLEEHDVCVIEVIDKANYVLLIHIFRVLWCPGEDPGLYTPKLTPDKSNKRKSSNGHKAGGIPGEGSQGKSKRFIQAEKQRAGSEKRADNSIGDEVMLRAGSGAGDQAEDRTSNSARDAAALESGNREGDNVIMCTENRAAEDSQTTQQAPTGLERHGYESDGIPREGSHSKRKRSQRDVRANKHTLEPDSAAKNIQHKRKLPGDDIAPPAKGKRLAIPNHEEEVDTSDIELLMDLVQKAVGQVPLKSAGSESECILLACGAGGEVASGAGDQVDNTADKGNPISQEQVLALFFHSSEKMLVQEQNGDRRAERPPSVRTGFPLALHLVNPDEVHEQILHAPVTGPFRGRELERRQEYKVVHIYHQRNVGSGTEFLTELEGYSERRSFASLDRDDDTGFWWVPSDQFDWDMMHCFLG